ncbi:hypothetical protein Btru_025762 [Bulinus truncatus]|nr:hypothetical protein Btru_025762 [Bulinus truncatus]
MVHQPTNSGSFMARHVTSLSIMAVAVCLLSSLPTHVTVAMSVRSTSNDRHSTASLDKELKQIATSGSGVDLMENPQPSSDDELYGKAQNSLGYDSEEDESPLEDVESLYSHEKSHPFQSKKLRLNKRYRLRNSKRRLRFQKRRQTYTDDVEYPRPEEIGNAFERDVREPRLRFHAHDMRRRSPSSLSNEHSSEAGNEDVERDQQLRHRRDAYPVFSVSRRVPIGNDLQALADLLYQEKQRQAYNQFKDILERVGKR